MGKVRTCLTWKVGKKVGKIGWEEGWEDRLGRLEGLRVLVYNPS